MLKVAIIGVAGYGKVHYDIVNELAERGELFFKTVVIRDREECPDLHDELMEKGFEIYSNAQDMFDEKKGELDLVFIPTGIPSHMPLSVAAMRAGINVFVEKPAAGTLEEVDKMIAVSKETGKYIAVGFQDIYRRDIQQIKQGLVNKEWGEVQSISIFATWPRPEIYYTRNSWAGRIKVGDSYVYDSPANNAFSHFMNLGLYFAGDEFAKSANVKDIEAELYRANEIESFDTIVCRAKSEAGITFHYAVSHATGVQVDPIIHIQTDQYRLELTWANNQIFNLNDELVEEIPYTTKQEERESTVMSMLELIEKGKSRVCTLEIAREHTKFIAQLHKDFEIDNFDKSQISKVFLNEDSQVHVPNAAHLVVKDLQLLLLECSKNKSLPSELVLK